MWGLSTADIVTYEGAWHQQAGSTVIRDPYDRQLWGPVLEFALRFPPLGRFVRRIALTRVTLAGMAVVVCARCSEQALERTIQEEGIAR